MQVIEAYNDGQFKSVIEYILQTEIDNRSFVDHYYFIKSLNRLSKIKEAIKYIEQLLGKKAVDDEIDRLKILYELIWAYHKEGNWTDANNNINQVFEIIESLEYPELNIKNKHVVNSMINLAGIIFYSIGELDKARHHLEQLLENAKDVKNETIIQGGKINLALIHMDRGNYSTSIEYLQKALELAEANNHLPHIRVAANNLTYIHTIIGDLSTAEEYATKTLNVSEKTNDRWGIAVVLYNIGLIFQKKGKYEEALNHLDRAYTLMQDFNNPEHISRTLLCKLLIQLDLQNRFVANEILQEMRSLSKRSNNSRVQLIYQLADAVYLKYSSLYRHKLDAEKKLKQLISTEIDIESELISYAYLFLIELLLQQLSDIQDQIKEDQPMLQKDEQAILLEVEELSGKVLSIANQQHAPELKLQVHYINAHLSILKLDTESLNYHLKQGERMAKEWDLVKVPVSKPDPKNPGQVSENNRVSSDLPTTINNIIHSLPRLKILVALSNDTKLTFSLLQDIVDLSSGNLSNHCKILIDKGYVHKRKEIVEDKFQTVYALTHTGRQAFNRYSSKVRLFLPT